MTVTGGLRERKKQRTRHALVTAAADLFERNGYEATTVAEIAAAAEVSTRTFFSYFPSKEAVLFADAAERVGIALEVIADRGPSDRPVDVLLRAVDRAIGGNVELLGRLGHVRVNLIRHTPALLGLMAGQVTTASQQITEAVCVAFPEADELVVAAMVGALMGSLIGVVTSLLTDPDRIAAILAQPELLQADLRRSTSTALRDLADAVAAPGSGRPGADH
jgi:AcrR family transcriptional regulator